MSFPDRPPSHSTLSRNTSSATSGPGARDNEPQDPHANLLNVSCFDFLLIELVPLAYRLASEQSEREFEWIEEQSSKGASDAGGGVKAKGGGGGKASVASAGGGIEGVDGEDEDIRENAHWRLDTLGYRVGLGIVERFSRDKPRFTDTLDVIKFLCKDVWTIVFRKQIDNLKTNHRGIYVLTDGTFKPLGRTSTEKGEGALARAQPAWVSLPQFKARLPVYQVPHFRSRLLDLGLKWSIKLTDRSFSIQNPASYSQMASDGITQSESWFYAQLA